MMKKLILPFLSVALLSSIVWCLAGARNTTALSAGLYTCGENGLYSTSSISAASLTTNDRNQITLANNWLSSMLRTTTTVATSSTILPSQDRPASYMGPLKGTVELTGATYPIVNTASIAVATPATIADSYRGVVTGTVLETPSSNRWIIQAYKRTNLGTSQVAIQALADGTTGAFSIDLSSVDPGVEGEWMFGLLDANASYAPHGDLWPTVDTYEGLEVQQFIVTDAIYYWASVPAPANGGDYWFENSNTGTKLYRLVDTNTNAILAEYVQPTGLVRSYQYEPTDDEFGTGMAERSYVYDQAMALFAAIASGKDAEAKLLVDGLIKFQTVGGEHDGGFVFAAPQLSPSYTDPFYRTGAHAIAVDALLAYIEAYGNDVDRPQYIADAKRALTFINTTFSDVPATSGLYLGGYGEYAGSPQVFNPSTVVSWASVEHNMDIWHVFMRAQRLFGAEYSTKASALATAIQSKLYNTAESRLNQGVNGGIPDTADPLDANTWGAIYLNASGKPSLATRSLNRLNLFSVTDQGVTGYAPFYSAGGYPGAVETVWYEGSFGAVLAYYRTGHYEEYRETLNHLMSAQQSDGSFRYSTTQDPAYDIGTSRSVAATAWFVVSTAGRDTMWNGCVYLASEAEQSVPNAPNTGSSSNRSIFLILIILPSAFLLVWLTRIVRRRYGR